MPDVLVAGGGPTGMMLAGELALAGVDVLVVERRPTPELVGSRAGGFHARTIEILDQRGIADRFLAVGRTAQTARFGSTVLDIGDLPTRHPYGLALWQDRFEPILAGWIAELGVPVLRGRAVTGFSATDDGVDVRLDDDTVLPARYLVGADGGRSAIRRAAGIAFPGVEASRSTLVAEVELTEEPPPGVRQDERGAHGLTRLLDRPAYRVVTTEQQVGPADDATLEDLSAALVAVFGTDFGAHRPAWISRFTDATRQAETYRAGRVLLAGDAAHIHYPAGGQGLGLCLQDAVNLGWKLGRVVLGRSPQPLLDTYTAERHPAGARALAHSMAQTVLQRADPRTAALAASVNELMALDEPRRRIGARIHGLDLAYDLTDDIGGAHPLVGRRMPDLDLATAAGPARVFALLHDARPLLLDLEGVVREAPAPASGVRVVAARTADPWELPVLGAVAPPSAVLVRPDGHVAWVGRGSDAGLADAIARWFGPGPAGPIT